MLAPTPCLINECPSRAVFKGKCAEHQPPAWTGSTRKNRLPSDWSTRRLIVLKRDKAICYVCNEPNADTIDHVVQGDDHSLHNLKPIHDATPPHCHRTKTANEAAKARTANRIKPRH